MEGINSGSISCDDNDQLERMEWDEDEDGDGDEPWIERNRMKRRNKKDTNTMTPMTDE